MLGEYDEATRLMREVLEAARRARDVESITFANVHLAWLYFMRADWETARRYLEENLQMPLSATRRRDVEQRLRWIESDLVGAARLAQELLEHHRHSGEEQGTYIYSGIATWLHLELDETAKAHAAAADAAAILERSSEYLLWSPALYVLEALIRGGDQHRGQALSDAAEALGSEVNSPWGLLAARFGLGILALEQRDADNAVRWFEESRHLANQLSPLVGTYVLRTLARALAQRNGPGDKGLARKHLEECVTIADRIGYAHAAARARAQLATLS